MDGSLYDNTQIMGFSNSERSLSQRCLIDIWVESFV